MKNPILLTFIFALLGANAKAEYIKLISIKSEAEPGQVAYIGVSTDAKNQISDITYESPDGKVRSFKPASLATAKVLCSKKGYTLVSMKVPKYTANTANLNLTYFQNVLTGDSKVKRFIIRYNIRTDRYEMLNEDQRQISSGYVTTHRNMLGVAVGIEDIRTQ